MSHNGAGPTLTFKDTFLPLPVDTPVTSGGSCPNPKHDESAVSNDDADANVEYQVYGRRWFMLATYFMIGAQNSSQVCVVDMHGGCDGVCV